MRQVAAHPRLPAPLGRQPSELLKHSAAPSERTLVGVIACITLAALFAGMSGCQSGNRASKGPAIEIEESARPVVADDPMDIEEAERFRDFRRRLVEPTLPTPIAAARGPLPPPITKVRTLETEATAGGTHHALAVDGDRWFQGFGSSLLLLDARNGRQLSSIDVAPHGTAGPIIDLHVRGDRVLALLERDAVAELAVSPAGLLSVRSLHFPDTLGVRPRRFRVAGDALWIVGEEGLVRFDDGRIVRYPNSMVTGAATIAGRLVVTANRRVMWDDERIARHAATTIVELPESTGAAAAIGLQVSAAVRISLLDGSLEELDTALVDGLARSMRFRDDRLWVVTDDAIIHFTVHAGRLADRTEIRVMGARDVDVAGPNRLAVSGSFGRALYRIRTERGNPGDEFFMAVREPSRLSRAITDGRRVLAGSREGRWLYLIGSRAERTERVLEAFNPVVEVANTAWGPATISADRLDVVFGNDDRTVRPLDGSLVVCLGEIDGELWIGHEYGIDVVSADSDGQPSVVARLRLDGPVLAIFQKWDRGAVYVAEFGGFGVARLVETPLESLGIADLMPALPARRR